MMIAQDPEDRPLRLALPSGALGNWTRDALSRRGLALSQPFGDSGVFSRDHSPELIAALGAPLDSMILPEGDIPIYVEHGVADMGVVRTHVLVETGVQVYRPFTFEFEAGQVALVAPEGVSLEALVTRPLIRVATPFRRLAQDFFASQGWNVELIPIGEQVELAPLLGLADAVLMLVEDEIRLESRGLRVVEEMWPCRAKLIANRATSRKRMRCIERLVSALSPAVDPTDPRTA